MAVRRFWYHNSLSFNYAKSYFYQAMVDAIASVGPGYKAPSYNALRGEDLDEELECVKEQLESIKSSWKFTGCTIMSDGWTNQRGRTIINFVVACPKGGMFLKSIDASTNVKDAHFIFTLFADVVEEVGIANVVQIIIDNAANYVAVGRLLCAKYPTIFWTPCAAHCIDLILEDIGKLEWVQDVVQEHKQITKYIYNHAWMLNLMREFTQGELNRPVVTQFATNFLSLQSHLYEYQALRRMFCSHQWVFWKDSTKPKVLSVKAFVLGDSLWDKVTEIVSFTEPFAKVLRLMDGEKPAMGYIHEDKDKAKEAIKTFYKGNESKYLPIWQIIDSGRDRQLHSPLHAAGAYLNLNLFYNEGSSIQRNPKVMRGVMICIEKMFPDQDIQDKINIQRDMYKEASGMFGFRSSQCLKDKKMPSHWWIDYGTEAPQLQEFAIRVLSQPWSVSSCEINWSVFQHIHSKKRNRLEHERLEKLVFIYYNLLTLAKQVQPKDTDPILLDTIDFEFDWVVEESPDLSWLDEETEDLSSLPSQMETPNTHASQLLQPSNVSTSSTRAYCRCSRP
eukprot:PITA_12588